MGRLLDWWGKLTGRPAEAASSTAQAARPAHHARPARAAGASPSLELSDDPPQGHSSRRGESGFDPYSSDAGFSKPHTWERVDHD
jgi:hypothetical protein